ncbi:hypothetical protein INR49_032595 [Caranx melampygus]|nr:hypothetical protein INR49_032595 [Caranx melampygus]
MEPPPSFLQHGAVKTPKSLPRLSILSSGKCRYVSERAYNASMIHRNPESLQLIGCWVLPLVGMDLLDKRTIF